MTNHLFKAALATGKRVRTETANRRRPSEPPVGLGDARSARRLGDLSGRIASSSSAPVNPASWRPAHWPMPAVHLVFVATRRRDRAVSFAEHFNADQRELR